ncbi:NeuD/PglB/VioB family sugar acetyltransferase [Sphingobium yanoikuyae]|jgi:sugar O-acyltransferase (sialic acid O-acetyltransferase NeuD family)|uniref:PglD N-terminal domain-containing protein n=1 Tax=Sphingobium yanoikuyae TaxID=13690 RepID=A0A430BN85_SPHYA|nr:NeuD/PglB/VioB family sugar acetyltransferase [Sphingobium yanoikuyae]RSU54186.1 hypothetical protein DAH51_20270 [Sphingobium yanoikuyae]
MALIIIAGASGQHAAVVYEAAILSGARVVGFATIEDIAPVPMFDCRWIGCVDSIAASEIARGTQFIIACGSNELRRRQSEALLSQGASLQSVYHPAAIVSPSASIGPGSTLLAGAIVGPRAALGCGVIINHAASVDHDCAVGDYSNISPGARFGGCVQAGPGVFVGLNAAVIQGLRLGENAIIGAGAVVTRNVAPGETVVGIPARPIGQS